VEQHLLGHAYNPVNLGFNCSGVEFPDIAYNDDPFTPPTSPGDNPNTPPPGDQLLDAIVHRPFSPTDSNPHIHVELPFTAHVDITLFNILGQKVATLYNEMMFEGQLDLNIRDRVPHHLATGKYIYRIEVQDRRLAKSIMVA
jgi:hypothetical protein